MSERPRIDLDGFSEGGDPFFLVEVSIPDELRFDGKPTTRQMDSISAFYGPGMAHVTSSQAHALLCYRTYGKLCADRIALHASSQARGLIAHFVAAIVSGESSIALDVLAWSDRRFEKAVEGSAVSRTKPFKWTIDRLEEALAYLEGAGVRVLDL